MEKFNKQLGELIKEYRKKKLKISVNQVAAKTGLTASAIYYWERGMVGDLKLRFFIRFASLLSEKDREELSRKVYKLIIK